MQKKKKILLFQSKFCVHFILLKLKLCTWNFQVSNTLFNSQKVIWILFDINPKFNDQFTRIKNPHFYEHRMHRTQTPIELIYNWMYKLIQILLSKDAISYSIGYNLHQASNVGNKPVNMCTKHVCR